MLLWQPVLRKRFLRTNLLWVFRGGHLGRPTEGLYEEIFSLKPVAKAASEIFGQEVEVVKSIEDPAIFHGNSSIQLLENIRFFEGEKANTEELGDKLIS